MSADKFVVYWRVSTYGPKLNGLILHEQEYAVAQFVSGRGEIVATYTEVEARHVLDRPRLLEAIQACAHLNAVLLFPHLGALARDASVLKRIYISGVSFICLDTPEADEGTVRLMIKLAEQRVLKSTRIKASLKAARERLSSLSSVDRAALVSQGAAVKLGGAVISASARATSAQIRKANAEARADFFIQTILVLKAEGCVTMEALADALNRKQVPMASGSIDWTRARVARLIFRLGPRLRQHEILPANRLETPPDLDQ